MVSCQDGYLMIYREILWPFFFLNQGLILLRNRGFHDVLRFPRFVVAERGRHSVDPKPWEGSSRPPGGFFLQSPSWAARAICSCPIGKQPLCWGLPSCPVSGRGRSRHAPDAPAAVGRQRIWGRRNGGAARRRLPAAPACADELGRELLIGDGGCSSIGGGGSCRLTAAERDGGLDVQLWRESAVDRV